MILDGTIQHHPSCSYPFFVKMESSCFSCSVILTMVVVGYISMDDSCTIDKSLLKSIFRMNLSF